MNSTVTVSRRGWSRGLVLTACVPIGLLLIGGIAIGVHEFGAAAELRSKLDQLKQSGEPYDNASMDQWYRRRTHPEGAQAWGHMLDSISATSQLGTVDRLPIFGNGKELSELDPQSEWRDEPLVKEYLDEMQGLIQQIHQLQKWPTPVQLPIEFQGVQTLLPQFQQSRNVTRVLQLDFEYAFYHKDSDRALEDLRSIGNVAKAIDSDSCLIIDLIVMATVNVRNQEIQRSLLTESWPAEKLNELRESVSHSRFTPAKWKALFTNERAMFGDDLASGNMSGIMGTQEASLVPLLKSGQLRIFEAYDELINVANSDFASLKSASKLATDRVLKRDATFDVDASSMLLGLILPAVEQMARAMENEESGRRLTLTAIALRQFKLQEGHLPARLSELEKVGLTAADICTVNRGAFGYEMADGVAYLWGSDWVGDLPVASSRPIIDPDTQTDGMKLITLR